MLQVGSKERLEEGGQGGLHSLQELGYGLHREDKQDEKAKGELDPVKRKHNVVMKQTLNPQYISIEF